MGVAMMSYDVISPLVIPGLLHVMVRELAVLVTKETDTGAATVCQA